MLTGYRTAALLGSVLALLAAAGPASASSAAGPWSNAGYAPQPGNWKPYVLAPTSRDVHAVAVAGAVGRSGTLSAPQDALGEDGRAATLASPGSDPTTSPRLTL